MNEFLQGMIFVSVMVLLFCFAAGILDKDTDTTAIKKLSKICAIVQADSDYIDNDSELYKACDEI